MKVLTKDPSVYWSSKQQKLAADRPLPLIQRLGFQKTRWGWFPWQLKPLEQLVHPFDVSVANRFVPGPRILTINPCHTDSNYLLAHYGHLSFRICPTLWREVPEPAAQLGDMVEISRLYSNREPLLATVEEITWDSETENLGYQLSSRGRLLPDIYSHDNFSLVNRVKESTDTWVQHRAIS